MALPGFAVGTCNPPILAGMMGIVALDDTEVGTEIEEDAPVEKTLLSFVLPANALAGGDGPTLFKITAIIVFGGGAGERLVDVYFGSVHGGPLPFTVLNGLAIIEMSIFGNVTTQKLLMHMRHIASNEIVFWGDAFNGTLTEDGTAPIEIKITGKNSEDTKVAADAVKSQLLMVEVCNYPASI